MLQTMRTGGGPDVFEGAKLGGLDLRKMQSWKIELLFAQNAKLEAHPRKAQLRKTAQRCAKLQKSWKSDLQIWKFKNGLFLPCSQWLVHFRVCSFVLANVLILAIIRQFNGKGVVIDVTLL
jgi:hypothetical protein